MAVEMLVPDGSRRIVVEDVVADALLGESPPFIVVERHTELAVNSSGSEFGFKELDPKEPDAADDSADEPDTGSDDSDDDGGCSDVTASSSDVTAKEAIAAIAELETEDDVYAYIDREIRSSVVKAGEKRAEKLRVAAKAAGADD
jgi:hypothetical protein